MAPVSRLPSRHVAYRQLVKVTKRISVPIRISVRVNAREGELLDVSGTDVPVDNAAVVEVGDGNDILGEADRFDVDHEDSYAVEEVGVVVDVDGTTGDAASFNEFQDQSGVFVFDEAAGDGNFFGEEQEIENDSNDSICDSEEEGPSLVDDLAKVYAQCKIPHSTINKINNVLRNHGLQVPKSARTHLKTIRKAALKTKNIFHSDLEKGILSRIKNGFT